MNSLFRSSILCLYPAAVLAAAQLLGGCATTHYTFPDVAATNTASPPVVIPPELTAAGPEDDSGSDLIRLGDRITITFSGTPTPLPKHEEKVRDDGQINPPLLPEPVTAAAKTIGDLQRELQDLYVPAYFKALTVTVTMEERWFFVGGEVRKPDRYLYSGKMTVLRAVQAAGDFSPFAKKKKVQVIRANGKSETVNCEKALLNPKLDLIVYPGDQVIVPLRRW